MTVLDAPTINTTILDEFELHEELPCYHEDAGATWRWVMVCCGETTYLCDKHDKRGKNNIAHLTSMFARCKCGTCGHSFGFYPKFSDVYRRHPI